MERLGGFENIFDLSESPILDEVEFFSGGGQGSRPKPPTKIQGSRHIQKQEKIRNIPKVKWPKVINPFKKK